MPEPIYKIRGLSKRYGTRTVLRELDFDVQRGESLVVLGLSGSGKSVTLRQLNGLEKPDSESGRQAKTALLEVISSARQITQQIQSGDGLLSKMLNDEDYAKKLTEELQELLQNLRVVSDRIAQSQGTLGLLISDPQVYEAMNDIIVGVDESSMLRWLVRNRQKKGIEKRYDAEQLELPQEVPANENSTTSGGTQ